MIEIKQWNNQEIIYTSEEKTISKAIEEAVIKGISLAYADLSRADLSETNLSGSDLSGAIIDQNVDIRKLLYIK